MKNKNVGYLIIGISIIIGIIVWIFNVGLKKIVEDTCTHGSGCSMYDTISLQTGFSLAIAGIILVIGLFLIFNKEDIKIITKKIHVETKRKPVDYSKLDKEEKTVVQAIEESEGTIFQSDLVEKSGFDKVKVTRILDRLEGKQIIERKRRGMTNIVILR